VTQDSCKSQVQLRFADFARFLVQHSFPLNVQNTLQDLRKPQDHFDDEKCEVLVSESLEEWQKWNVGFERRQTRKTKRMADRNLSDVWLGS